jgi:hypothetical protein
MMDRGLSMVEVEHGITRVPASYRTRGATLRVWKGLEARRRMAGQDTPRTGAGSRDGGAPIRGKWLTCAWQAGR